MPNRIHPIFAHDYITVTDIPNIAGPGMIAGYRYLDADSRALQEYQQAGAGLLRADRNLLFWRRLAARVARTNVARCHGCAAFAAQKLLGHPAVHNMAIWICGRGDHYFVVLSTSPRVIATAHLRFNTNIFNPTDIIVDLWFYNVTRQQTGRRDYTTMAMTVPNFTFITGRNDIQVFVRYV